MRSRRIARCALAAGALALACGGEEAPQPTGAPMARNEAAAPQERAENQPPQVDRVVLHPPRPLPGNTIEARIEASDPDGDPVRLDLEWRQNGRVISSGAETAVAPEHLRKNDEIELRVTATDGRDESEPVHVTAAVGNQAPLIQALYLTPDGEVRPGQPVTAAPQGLDADGDPLEYEFEWWLNGHVVRGADTPAFDTGELVRGDRLQAKVRVTDGEEWSPVAESMVLELANRPPKIAGLPPIESVAGGGISAELKAEDPDGDKSLRFRLIEGPPGLDVDAMTGHVSWHPEPGTTGTQPVEIAVADSYGAESALRFELTVSPAKEEKAAEGKRKAAPAPPAKKESADDEDAEE
jgi:Putative Ig domain